MYFVNKVSPLLVIPISLVTVSVPPTVTKVKPFGHVEVIRD